MGTVEWRELRSLAAVILLVAGLSATTVTSCGGGGGSPDGKLCQQCGDTDGPCISPATIDDEERPSFCPAEGNCQVRLLCVRKLDSGQRRCFPADPASNRLDVDYECDGERPDPSGNPTTTSTPQPTTTPLATTTPEATSTGPTATALTPTPTGATLTPTPAVTPAEVDVSITIDLKDEENEDFTSGFTVTVSYPSGKGNFLSDGAVDCEEDELITPADNGNGTLTLTFQGDDTGFSSTFVDCIFHQVVGQTLLGADLHPSVSSDELTVTVELP